MEIHRWTESIHILFTKTCRTTYSVLPALDANSLIAGLPHPIIRSGSTTALTVARCEGRGGRSRRSTVGTQDPVDPCLRSIRSSDSFSGIAQVAVELLVYGQPLDTWDLEQDVVGMVSMWIG